MPGQENSQNPTAAPTNTLNILIGSAAVVVVAAGIKTASGLLGPVMLALVLVIGVSPVSGWAKRRGWPNWVGAGLALLIVNAILIALILALSLSVVQLTAVLPQYAPKAQALVTQFENGLERIGFTPTPTSAALGQLDLSKVTGFLSRLLGDLLGVLSNVFFLLALLFFLLAEAGQFPSRLIDSRGTTSGAAAQALVRFAGATRNYLLMTAVFGAIVAVLDGLALWLLGVPLPWMWALLSFITNFIPNIGFIIGLIPPALLGLLDGGWTTAVAVILIYSLLNLTIQTFIQPRYVGDAVGLSPTVTFLSLALWAYLLGPVGAILAVPMTLLTKALLLDPYPRARWAADLIASPPSVQIITKG